MKQILILCSAVFLLLISPRAFAQGIDPCLARGGALNAETGACVVASGLSFEINYPLELLDYPFAMSVVDEFLNSSRLAFLSDFTTMGIPSSGAWSFISSYEIFQYTEEILSIRFDLGFYTGGAHGNQTIRSFTFDLANETVLVLPDLFSVEESAAIEVLSPLVQAQLSTNMGEFADADWIATGTGLEPLNYQDFVLTPNSIIFYFEPYQVAAYAAGIQQAEIPLSALTAILQPRFIPAEN